MLRVIAFVRMENVCSFVVWRPSLTLNVNSAAVPSKKICYGSTKSFGDKILLT